MLVQALTLAALGLGAYYFTSSALPTIPKKHTTQYEDYTMYARDHAEAGISWGTQRTGYKNLANLNQVYKPRSAPMQEDTNNVKDVFFDQADIDAWVTQNAFPFYFMRNPTIPLATAHQSNLNIEIPMYGQSFRGDHFNSLAYYPRVYSDRGKPTDRAAKLFTGEPGTLGAEEPTESEELYVSKEGNPNYQFNPWGPGGVVQRIMNRKSEKRTKKLKADQSRIGGSSRLRTGQSVYD